MPKGGARVRAGRPEDPTAFRRERESGEWTILPAAGRKGFAPQWPLVERSDRENELWLKLWRKPQALMWERFGQDVEVALYVRNLTMAELPGCPVNLGTLVRQLGDSLGLSSPGLRANRWRIAPVETDAERLAPTADGVEPPTARVSARDRLKVVPSGDVE